MVKLSGNVTFGKVPVTFKKNSRCCTVLAQHLLVLILLTDKLLDLGCLGILDDHIGLIKELRLVVHLWLFEYLYLWLWCGLGSDSRLRLLWGSGLFNLGLNI